MNFAREHGLLLSIRSGGHQIAGLAVADGGAPARPLGDAAVAVDPGTRTARVEPGAHLAESTRRRRRTAWRCRSGINSTTGIAGLTLGGGFGWITRKFGLTIDNLIAADVVTADGSLRRASAEREPGPVLGDQGGGGNFGVVTAFEFRLHPLGPEVVAGLLIHPIEAAPETPARLPPHLRRGAGRADGPGR